MKRVYVRSSFSRRFVCALAVLMVMAAMMLHGCAARHRDFTGDMSASRLAPITERVDPGESVAVSWISDAETYDITALGNLFRDQIEKAFSDARISVKGRRDLNVVLEDIETFGLRDAGKNILEKAGAEIVVTGNYRVIIADERPASIKLMVKALRIESAEVIGAAQWTEPLAPDWPQLASRRVGNVYQNKIDTITSPALAINKPLIRARFNKAVACYTPGEAGTIHVETEPGVYLYLFNLAEDGTVTLLYPNRLCPFVRLEDSSFTFPPKDCLQEFDLVFYPLQQGGASRESIKVVASRTILDFEFLPVPINQVFLGAEGGDVKRVYELLDKADSWNQVGLSYTVGDVCKK